MLINRLHNFHMKNVSSSYIHRLSTKVLIGILVFLPAGSVFALSPFDIGGAYNPIHIEIHESQQQTYQRAQNELWNMMRREVSYVAQCSEIYDAIQSFKRDATGMNATDPAVALSIAQYLGYLYQVYDMCASSVCPEGHVRNAQGICVTPDDGCKEHFGRYSQFTGYNQDGGPECGCIAGYTWNSSGTACTPIPPQAPQLTNQEICQRDFGPNSVWNGEINNSGALVCDCALGFEWNSSRNSCVVRQPETSTVDYHQVCQAMNGVWAGGTSEGGQICRCAEGLEWNSAGTSCIEAMASIETESTERASAGRTSIVPNMPGIASGDTADERTDAEREHQEAVSEPTLTATASMFPGQDEGVQETNIAEEEDLTESIWPIRVIQWIGGAFKRLFMF
jgi:hypothetical protein